MSSFASSNSERIEIDLSDQLKDTSINDDSGDEVISHEDNKNKSSLEEEFGERIPLPSASRTSPVVVLVIGMAGAGKSSLMHRINLYANEKGIKGYYVNLDPAVTSVPFGVNIDIRDTINYKEVMSQYGLGPNGAILTSLNLFATRFDQVVGLMEKRADNIDYIFIDTPGQIEAFTWSAGGTIIQEYLASSFPTTILYVSDTARCSSPTTFMSNMLYACSVLYKSRLPIIIGFNKIDVVPCEFAKEWMDDFESYMDALDSDKEEYMSSFNRSLNLVMDEFYKNITRCGVSAATGEGMEKLFACFDKAAIEFQEDYLPDLQRRIEEKELLEKKQKDKDMKRVRKDILLSKGDKEI